MLKTNVYDAIIIGGGYCGLLTAIGLHKNGAKVLLLEKNPHIRRVLSHNVPGRLLAISAGSLDICEKFGIANIEGQSINHIRVWDCATSAIIDFSPEMVRKQSFGTMIDESEFLNKIYEKLLSLDIEHITSVKNIKIDNNAYSAQVAFQHHDTGIEYTACAPLLIVANGKMSTICIKSGIQYQKYNYNQYGLVCDVSHAEDHCGVAVEQFRPDGAFAILPKIGGYRSSLVWVVKAENADISVECSHKELEAMINERFGQYLGGAKLETKIKAFPLMNAICKQFYAQRMVVIGDAAHAMHPLAGQGVNLGIRDVRDLVAAVSEQMKYGLDLGDINMLKEYNIKRKFDADIMAETVLTLNNIFISKFFCIKLLRYIGLNAVNYMDAIKQQFVRYAMYGP